MSDYLPWIEKYRPNNIEDIISHDQNITTIKQLLINKSLPHLLFYGSPGTGKTSTIIALAKYIYGDNARLMVMKLDASDDRGINSVRDEIKGFAEKSNMFHKGIRLIILDEVDSMTFDAQFALRRIIEKYSESIRFCLICNYENKIIPAIRSRCANFRFNNIDIQHIKKKLYQISEIEKLNYEEGALDSIAILSQGDLRKAINLIQSISMRTKYITINDCYDIACTPLEEEINNILYILLNNEYDFNISYNEISKIIKNKNYSLLIILKELLIQIINVNDNTNHKLYQYIKSSDIANIVLELSNLENMITKTIFYDIYVTGLIGIFKKN